VGLAESAHDRGETLIELLVAVLIMSTAVVAVVGGLGTAILMSDIHRKQSIVAADLNAFAAAIQGAVATSPGYIDCATGSGGARPYPSYTPDPGYQADIPQVRYWNATTSTFTTSCTLGSDPGAQLLTLHVRSSDGRVDRSINIVVRKPCRPADASCA
jgi:type II secretory pathway pseudopilin PulG